MNKRVYISIFVLFLLALSFVSADSLYEDVKDVGNGIISAITSITETLFNVDGGDNLFEAEDLLAYVLLYLLLMAIIYSILDRIEMFNQYSWVLWMIAIIVPYLSIRFLKQGWIEAILLPYSVLGVAMTAILPMALLFFWIKDFNSSILRKISWIFVASIFIGLYFTRLKELADAAKWIYPAAALASLSLVFLDGTIKKIFRKHINAKAKEIMEIKNRNLLKKEWDSLQDTYLNHGMSEQEFNILKKNIKRRAKNLGIDLGIK